MQELIERLESRLGIDEPTAEQVVGIILGAVKSEGPNESVDKLLRALPGADDLISKARSDVQETSSFGGILSHALAPLVGGELLVEAFGKLKSVGLDMDQAKTAAYELMDFAREKAGSDVVDEILDETPALKNLV